MPDALRNLGRFLEPALLILVSLAGGPRHGYAMMEEIERLTGSRIGPGTLYGALARLESRGLIEPMAAEDRRRPYRLTDAGARLLGSELRGLATIARVGLERLGTT